MLPCKPLDLMERGRLEPLDPGIMRRIPDKKAK
jgi:hypothetical protein